MRLSSPACRLSISVHLIAADPGDPRMFAVTSVWSVRLEISLTEETCSVFAFTITETEHWERNVPSSDPNFKRLRCTLHYVSSIHIHHHFGSTLSSLWEALFGRCPRVPHGPLWSSDSPRAAPSCGLKSADSAFTPSEALGRVLPAWPSRGCETQTEPGPCGSTRPSLQLGCELCRDWL